MIVERLPLYILGTEPPVEAGTDRAEFQSFGTRESPTIFVCVGRLLWEIGSVEVPEGMKNVELKRK